MSQPNNVHTKTILNSKVDFRVHYGTVLEADQQATWNGQEAVGVWLKGEDGNEYRLPLHPGAVSARQGHSFCWLDIETPEHLYEDAARYNLTTKSMCTNVRKDTVADRLASSSLRFRWLAMGPVAGFVAWYALDVSTMSAFGISAALCLAILIFMIVLTSFREKQALKQVREALQLISFEVGKRSPEIIPTVSESQSSS